jgi:hypothetical protein
MEKTTENVFDYIIREENNFKFGTGVPIVDGWDWKMHEHIRKSTLYKYGQLANRTKTDDDPVINIILPILNVSYRSEDIDLKDIIPYVDDPQNNHKSLIVKKFHDRWARQEEFEMDEFIDDLKTEKTDYGLTLIKKGSEYPEVVPLQRIAFCDQTDILSGAICEKHSYTPEQLLEMKGKWDDEAIDELITLSRSERSQQQVKTQKQKTPSQYIEVYELHGVFSEEWNPKIDDPDPDAYSRQLHIVSFYTGEDADDRKGIALYQGVETDNPYDALKRDKIYGRACGYGGVEELFEPQVWHTYSAIQKKEMLDVAANMIVMTTDAGLARRQKITDLEKGEMLEIEEGKDAKQLVLQPINWQVFDDWQEQMKLTAQTQGSANDPQLGVEPKSGTPFSLQRLTTVQGQGLHEYRRGKMATFIAKLYRKWFLKQMVAEINKGDEWMEVFNLDELKDIAEKLATNKAEKKKKELILKGRATYQDEIDAYKEKIKQKWLDIGEERSIKALKDELKNINVDVKINITDKQKNLIEEADKIVNFMRLIISNPMILQNKGFADLMSQIIEKYGLNPVDFQKIGESQAELQAQASQVAQETPQAQASQVAQGTPHQMTPTG